MDSNKKKEALRLSVVSSLGLMLVISTFMGYGIGAWLDHKFQTKPALTIVFVLLGIGAGFINLFRVMNKN